MIAFLIIVYSAVVLLLFKVLRIRPTVYRIASIILAGILMIGAVVVVWTQAAPISDKLVTSQYIVELVPYVKGQVKAVHAQALQPIMKGDLLLEIDPEPYKYALNQVEAQLAAAKDTVKQAEATLEAAKAAVVNAQANLVRTNATDELAKLREQIALNLQRQSPGAISKLNLDKAVQERQAQDAAVQQAAAAITQSQASAHQAAAALETAQSNVPAIEAQLDEARFNLSQCKMTAPGDGYVVNWQVQVGTMLVPAPIAAAGSFVVTSDTAVAAVFPQNWLSNVQPGNDVDMVLNPYPGRLFFGKVDYVISGTGGGQFTTGGTIPNAPKMPSDGLIAVRINFTDDSVARRVSLGSGGSAAIYTDTGKPTHIISKVAIRMKKWLLRLAVGAEVIAQLCSVEGEIRNSAWRIQCRSASEPLD
jgi:membrane fusion protein, multidrug efflux system